jgi:drug/metabolite transporter (DMT)-like permease
VFILKSTTHVLTYTALTAVAIFWGLSFVATKIALETFPIFTLVFIRFSVAAFFFFLLMLNRGFPKFSGRDHARVFLMALFEPGLYFIFETIGLQYTSAPKTALLIATIPVAVLVFAFLFIGERPALTSILGIGLSLVGISILIVGDPQFSWQLGGSLVGDLLIIGAVVTAALYMVCARNLGQGHNALDITGLQMMYGALLYTPLFFWELPAVHWSAISVRSLVALAYLTVFATCAAFLCYNYALTKLPAGKAAVFINGIPVVTAIGAWILLGETLTLLQLCGGIIVLTAVCLTNLSGMKIRGSVVAEIA